MVVARSKFGALTGLDHIGIGVSDVAVSMAFYGELGFDDVAFDYSGPLPGLSGVSSHDQTDARVVLLLSSNPTVLGRAGIKLVQTLSRPCPPMPEGMA
jgi:catechol 2,3-dioxygenase-like lactoylglutathione lyase family enzyme